MDMFWKGGVKNVENEQEAMGIIQSEELPDDSDATSVVG